MYKIDASIILAVTEPTANFLISVCICLFVKLVNLAAFDGLMTILTIPYSGGFDSSPP